MKHYNCIVIFNKEKSACLFCKRSNDPYKGKYNFVGGKVEPGEASEDAAYRELYEETGNTRRQIRLSRCMDITYYHQEFVLEIYAGILEDEVELHEEKNPLLWLPLTEDFTDRERFAGEQNIAHIINVALLYPLVRKDMMSDGIYIGIDSCKKGWIAAILDYGHLHIKRYKTISEIIAEYPAPCTYLIDMPIGLPEQESDLRPDRAAREKLGSCGSSVFPVPCRQAVYQIGQNSEETESLQKEVNKHILGKSLSKQATAIIPKIRELDEFLAAHEEYKNVICESHPELCFARLNGEILQSKKNSSFGIAERGQILSQHIKDDKIHNTYKPAKELECKQDDILDAVCLAVTAALKAHGLTETIPAEPHADARGLRMQMVAPK